MIDRLIGHEFAPVTAELEKGRLRFFAKATGNADPVYSDEAAAKAAGYPSPPAPPHFFSVWRWIATTRWIFWTC